MTDEEKIDRLEGLLRAKLAYFKTVRQITDKTNTQMLDLIRNQETDIYMDYFTAVMPIVGNAEAGRIYEKVVSQLNDEYGTYRPMIGYLRS
jgi:hypothetical protein